MSDKFENFEDLMLTAIKVLTVNENNNISAHTYRVTNGKKI